MPTLYLVGTPIGNLEDMTFRAVRVLKEAALIAAEDSRHARILLSRHGIKTRVTRYHEQGALSKASEIVGHLAQGDVALISDAGMPVVSDPGFGLVRAALEAGYPVTVVPGPSAVTTALALSGLPSNQFFFAGFPPRTRAARRRFLEQLEPLGHTLVLLEAPHRLRGCLEDALAALGDRPIAVCRELTKLHEEVYRGTISEALKHFLAPRGEFTIVMGGTTEKQQSVDLDGAARLLKRFRAEGLGAKDAVGRTSRETDVPRKVVYRLWLDVVKGGPSK